RARRYAAALGRLARGRRASLSLHIAARTVGAAGGPCRGRRGARRVGGARNRRLAGRARAFRRGPRAGLPEARRRDQRRAAGAFLPRRQARRVHPRAPDFGGPPGRPAPGRPPGRSTPNPSRGAGTPPRATRPGLPRRAGAIGPPRRIRAVRDNEVGDRQLDALLERLDRMNAELHALNRRLDAGEHLAPIVHELRTLNESLQPLAYA